MSLEPTSQDRDLASGDPALHPGWRLLEFLMALGADEFSVRFRYAGDAKGECDRLAEKLAFASLGQRTRECTVTFDYEVNPRPVEVWRLDRESLAALRDVSPEGVLGPDSWKARAWAEDLCVYRDGALLFGAVSHEQIASLRLTEAEWQQWKAQPPDDRRAT
jgi:hypothetical protein